MRLTPGSASLVGIVEGGAQADVGGLGGTNLATSLQALMVRAALYGWDGTTWDRIRSAAINVDGEGAESDGVLEVASRLSGFNETSWDRIRSEGNDRDAIAEATLGFLQTIGFLHGFNTTTWDRLRSEGNDRDAIAVETLGKLEALGYGHLFNGTTWDRRRSNEEKTLLASATRAASVTSPDQTNRNGKGIVWVINVTARTVGASPLIRVILQVIDPVSGSSTSVVDSPDFNPAVGRQNGIIYPGAQAVAVGALESENKQVAGLVVPRTYALRVSHEADVTNLTYSLAVTEI